MTESEIGNKLSSRCWTVEGVWGDSSCNELSGVVHCNNCKVHSLAGDDFLKVAKNVVVSSDVKTAAATKLSINAKNIIIFGACSRHFAVETKNIARVCQLKSIHRLPHSSNKHIDGIVNIDGTLIASIDIATFVENAAVETAVADSSKKRTIVCAVADTSFAFTADMVSAAARIDDSMKIADGNSAAVFEGALYKIDNLFVTLLDIELVAHFLARRRM